MCRGKALDNTQECPMRRTCFRATAVPTTFAQRYYAKLPLRVEDGAATCDLYLDNQGALPVPIATFMIDSEERPAKIGRPKGSLSLCKGCGRPGHKRPECPEPSID